MNEKEIINEIYWIFRNVEHDGHNQIEIKDGKAIINKPKLKDTKCYVCDILHKVEGEIADIFGDEYGVIKNG